MLDTTQSNLIGYARVSTDDQDLSLQVAALKKFGVADDRIYREHASGKSMNRPVWKDLMAALQPGDTVVIWKLDRMGRKLFEILRTIETMKKMGVTLRTVEGVIDMSSPIGRLTLHVTASVAEFERDMIAERTKAGMAVKRAQGVKFGAPHMIRDNELRLTVARELSQRGLLEQLTARELQAALNAADPSAKKIGHVNTVRVWRRDGYPGLEQIEKKET
jgi:DNA invertase Pin-like site-specific DNA recombinase